MADGDARRLEMVTEELLNLYEEVNVLYTVSEIAAHSADVRVAGARILEEAVALFQADVGFIVYTEPGMSAEEPDPIGLASGACHELAAILAPKIETTSGSIVAAPFIEGAGVPRAPEAIVAATLSVEKETFGIICIGRRGRGAAFSSGDQKILSVLGTQTALVIAQRRNLDLTRASRSLEERAAALRGVAEVGREIASSLDLDRILRALADLPARLLGFDRCGVLLDDRGTLRLRALTGVTRIDREEPSVASLEGLLVWIAGRGRSLTASAALDADGGIVGVSAADLTVPGDTSIAVDFRERAARHFESGAGRALLLIPLADDQGVLGAIGFETATPEVMTDASREAAQIVAQQATVALRNARLYRELPFVSILEPMRRGRARLKSFSGRRVAIWAGGIAVLVVVALLIPWDLRVPGTFTLQPGRRVEIVSRVRGVIREIPLRHDGETIHAGDVLARLDDTDWRLRRAGADLELQKAQAAVAKAESLGRAAELQLARLDAQRWRTEKDLLDTKISDAVLRAPQDGILLTPRLVERTGELLDVGSTFCALAALGPMRAEIAVPESEADAIISRMPETAALKFQAFPEREIVARVVQVRPVAELIHGEPSLVVEADVLGGAADLRPGMTGEARVNAGASSVAWLAIRRPYRFLRRSLWW